MRKKKTPTKPCKPSNSGSKRKLETTEKENTKKTKYERPNTSAFEKSLKEEITFNDKITDEQVYTFLIPDSWKQYGFTDVDKKKFIQMNVTLGERLDRPDCFVNVSKLLSECIASNYSDDSVKQLLKIHEHWSDSNINQSQIMLTKCSLFRVLNPDLCLKGCTSPSEIELTSRFYSALLGLNDLFPPSKTYSNTTMGTLCKISPTLFSKKTKQKAESIQPDRFVTIPLKISKYGESVDIIRFLEEDKPEDKIKNYYHDDLIKLVGEMRTAHSHNIRSIFREKCKPFHSRIATYGLLTTPSKVEVLAMTCRLKKTEKDRYSIHYILSHLGSFNPNSTLSSYTQSISNSGAVESSSDPSPTSDMQNLCTLLLSLFTNCFKEFETVAKYITNSSGASIISSAKKEKNEDQKDLLTVGEKFEVTRFKKTISCTIEKLIKVSERSTLGIGRNTDSESKLYVKSFNNISKRENRPTNSLYFTQDYLCRRIEFSLPGIPLTTYMTQNNLNTQQKLHIMYQLSCELLNIHTELIIHNDIKPDNIVLYNNKAKLIDFEGSKRFSSYDLSKETCTYENTLVTSTSGSPDYFPPEKLETTSDNSISPKTDIYSMGKVFLDILGCGNTDKLFVRLKSLAENKMVKDYKHERISSGACKQALKQYARESNIELEEIPDEDGEDALVKNYFKENGKNVEIFAFTPWEE